MAITLVQSAGRAVATGDNTVGSGQGWNTPTTGNVLIAFSTADVTHGIPTGWTLAASAVDWAACYLFYKVSDGTETSVTISPGAHRSILNVYEYSGLDNVTLVDVATSNNRGSSGLSVSTGTTATSSVADALVFAGVGSYASTAETSVSSWTNDFTELDDTHIRISGGNISATASRIVSATGTFETTATFNNSVTNPSGCIAVFAASTGGGGDATFTANAGNANSSGGSASFAGTANATFTATAGNADSAGASAGLTGGAAFSASAGGADAVGGSAEFTTSSGATFTTLAGNADANGDGSASFDASSTFTATSGSADADGGQGVLSGTGAATFTTLTGDSTATGGAASSTASSTFTATAGTASAEGGAAAFQTTGTATFVALAGDATASGGDASFTASSTFTAAAGNASSGGGTGTLSGGADVTFTTTAGPATATGGSATLTGSATFSIVEATATAGGGASSFVTPDGLFVTVVAVDATAAGGNGFMYSVFPTAPATRTVVATAGDRIVVVPLETRTVEVPA